ncbi:Cyclic di-GMP phosphodiesterase CdpA [Rhodococcoides fascians]|uniref:Cyclic di-GMP phosphodiesterase CdpA n=1 Tax=Rhodococcoides fascians TaxID=1828 RepID=A0A143QJY7_RHOFA|nr:Cyclic di-GMP phosphodiesterase CdpA [Rhodococcus fascians]OZC38901.1 EAL domain-containing protein [Rhodococcus fascians]
MPSLPRCVRLRLRFGSARWCGCGTVPLARAASTPLRSTLLRSQRRVEAVIAGGGPDIVFQPIVRARDGVTEGYEALSRFPAGGGDTEAWFADAAQCGLGPALDRSAAVKALAESARLPGGCFVAVNLSAATLLIDAALVDVLLDFGRRRPLVVELTEHAAQDDEDAVVAVSAELRRGGVAVAVDDVGSGYAGMRQLVVLEPQIIKLDAFVVHGMKGSRVKSALAELVLEFARKTEARCVFEGIETDDDLEAATSIGADLLQGYRIGRPAAM